MVKKWLQLPRITSSQLYSLRGDTLFWPLNHISNLAKDMIGSGLGQVLTLGTAAKLICFHSYQLAWSLTKCSGLCSSEDAVDVPECSWNAATYYRGSTRPQIFLCKREKTFLHFYGHLCFTSLWPVENGNVLDHIYKNSLTWF